MQITSKISNFRHFRDISKQSSALSKDFNENLRHVYDLIFKLFVVMTQAIRALTRRINKLKKLDRQMSREFDEFYNKYKVIPTSPTKIKKLKYAKTRKFTNEEMYKSNTNIVNEASHESSNITE